MWLTLIISDLCIYVYILTPHPPVAHAYPRLTRTYIHIHTHIRVGEGNICVTIHQHKQNASIYSDLRAMNNCYAISCQCLHCTNSKDTETKTCCKADA